MMNIQTNFFGETEINEENIIKFNDGVLGFENNRNYVVLNLFDNDSFVCLQSTTNSSTAFILVKPWDFFDDYEVNIPNEDLEEIDIKNEGELVLYNIVSIPNDLKEATANLLAPVVININKREGKQYVLKEDKYSTKHYIFPREDD